jgi:hypothetical protein
LVVHSVAVVVIIEPYHIHSGGNSRRHQSHQSS